MLKFSFMVHQSKDHLEAIMQFLITEMHQLLKIDASMKVVYDDVSDSHMAVTKCCIKLRQGRGTLTISSARV